LPFARAGLSHALTWHFRPPEIVEILIEKIARFLPLAYLQVNINNLPALLAHTDRSAGATFTAKSTTITTTRTRTTAATKRIHYQFLQQLQRRHAVAASFINLCPGRVCHL